MPPAGGPFPQGELEGLVGWLLPRPARIHLLERITAQLEPPDDTDGSTLSREGYS